MYVRKTVLYSRRVFYESGVFFSKSRILEFKKWGVQFVVSLYIENRIDSSLPHSPKRGNLRMILENSHIGDINSIIQVPLRLQRDWVAVATHKHIFFITNKRIKEFSFLIEFIGI